MVGTYIAYDRMASEPGMTKDLLPQIFGQSLASNGRRTPNYLQDMSFTSQLGSPVHPVAFRDLRVWNYMRDAE